MTAQKLTSFLLALAGVADAGGRLVQRRILGVLTSFMLLAVASLILFAALGLLLAGGALLLGYALPPHLAALIVGAAAWLAAWFLYTSSNALHA